MWRLAATRPSHLSNEAIAPIRSDTAVFGLVPGNAVVGRKLGWDFSSRRRDGSELAVIDKDLRG
eukprot:355723-Rhodomonas_salina.3